jgi:hypothetical protein
MTTITRSIRTRHGHLVEAVVSSQPGVLGAPNWRSWPEQVQGVGLRLWAEDGTLHLSAGPVSDQTPIEAITGLAVLGYHLWEQTPEPIADPALLVQGIDAGHDGDWPWGPTLRCSFDKPGLGMPPDEAVAACADVLRDIIPDLIAQA